MAYVWQRWLADEFRAAGLTVVEVEGWENRGRPASTGHYDPNGSVTKHHTGTRSSLANPHPTLRLLILGRLDLPGPLAPWTTGYDGTIYVIAAGRCNHAGRVGKPGQPGLPLGADGNALAMGDEVDTDGTQPLPDAQKQAMAIAAAVVLKHFDRLPAWVHRHADISATGKWDLGSLTTQQIRDLTTAALDTLEDPMADYEAQLDQIEANTKALLNGQDRAQRQNAAIRSKVTKLVRKGNATRDDLADLAATLEED